MDSYPQTITLTDEQRDTFVRELRAFADDDIIRAAAVRTDTFCTGAAFYARTAAEIESTGVLQLTDAGQHEDVCSIFWAKGWLQPGAAAPAALVELGAVLFEEAAAVAR